MTHPLSNGDASLDNRQAKTYKTPNLKRFFLCVNNLMPFKTPRHLCFLLPSR
jgi:hypothetical protein